MPNRQHYIGRCVLVIRGSFNPAILHPEWFEKYSILPIQEYDELTSDPKKYKDIPEMGMKLVYGPNFQVNRDHAFFKFKSFIIDVQRDRFDVICESREKFKLITSFVLKTFKILQETPISAFGINFEEHYLFDHNYQETMGKYFETDNQLNEIFGDECGVLYKIESVFDDIKMNFHFAPSIRLENGIYIKANFHYEVEDMDAPKFCSTLNENFNKCVDKFESIIHTTFGEFKERWEK